jgi:dUTP pyrophosphatase
MPHDFYKDPTTGIRYIMPNNVPNLNQLQQMLGMNPIKPEITQELVNKLLDSGKSYDKIVEYLTRLTPDEVQKEELMGMAAYNAQSGGFGKGITRAIGPKTPATENITKAPEVRGSLVVDVKFKKLHPDAQMPEYKTPGAAAMDLYAVEDANLHHGEVCMVSTGIAIALPEGYEAQIRARSGNAAKGIIVVNGPGTIDSDYRGEIKVLLATVTRPHAIKKGDRIAQMLIAPVYKAKFTEVVDLEATERGSGGFGSTGV